MLHVKHFAFSPHFFLFSTSKKMTFLFHVKQKPPAFFSSITFHIIHKFSTRAGNFEAI